MTSHLLAIDHSGRVDRFVGNAHTMADCAWASRDWDLAEAISRCLDTLKPQYIGGGAGPLWSVRPYVPADVCLCGAPVTEHRQVCASCLDSLADELLDGIQQPTVCLCGASIPRWLDSCGDCPASSGVCDA